jgi:ribosomal protein L23
MDLSHVLKGPIVTEKAERQKLAHTYTLQVHPDATKVEIARALKEFYDVDVASVRVLRVRPKVRELGAGKSAMKRHRSKRAIVRLAGKRPTLDLASFKKS